jgi:hypothetical protein
MADRTSPKDLDIAKRVMGALVRQPPKPHDEMKIGKPKARKAKESKRNPIRKPKCK